MSIGLTVAELWHSIYILFPFEKVAAYFTDSNDKSVTEFQSFISVYSMYSFYFQGITSNLTKM